MILKVLKAPDKILSQESFYVEEITDEVRNLCDDLIETMIYENAYGLSAVQVGRLLRIFVMNYDSPKIFINPKIISHSEDIISFKEGFVSIPKVLFKVDRWKSVELQYMDINGNINTDALEGIDSVCSQHELNHLDGVLMIDYAKSKLKRKMLLDKSRRLR